MKKNLTRTAIAAMSAAGILSLAVSGVSHAAGTAAFSLSPNGATETQGTNFSVAIYEDGSSVNVVTANFSYNTSDLQLVSTDTSASAFTDDAGSTATSISRYVPAGGTVSGTQEVAVLNFKALATGSATVTVGTSGSHIASAGVDEWNNASTTAQYTVNAPASTGTTGGGTTTSPTTGGSTTTTSTPTTSPSSSTSSTPTSKASAPTSTASTVPQNSTTTTSTNTAPGASTTKQNKKTTTPAKHIASHHTDYVTSGAGILVIAVGLLYWFFIRKTPVVSTVSATKVVTPSKTMTASGTGKKTAGTTSKSPATKTQKTAPKKAARATKN